MIILSSFKAFDEGFGNIQRAAIKSWQTLASGKIIIIGDHESGVAEACKEHALINIPTNKVKTDFDIEGLVHRYGSPILDSIVEIGEDYALDNEIVCIVNGDIIFTKSAQPIIDGLNKLEDPLAIARRYGIQSPEVASPTAGELDAPGGADCFMWRKGFFKRNNITIPKFILGRPAWDNWMMGIALSHSKPGAIDITESLHGCHPYHGYRRHQIEAGAEYNRQIAHYSTWRTMNDGTWIKV